MLVSVANTHEETVKREDVTHNLDVRVNKYTIQQVVNHGKATFPGAPVVSVPRELERLPPDVRHSFESSVSDGKHLNISDASVKRKTNVTRTKGRAELHELHKEAAEAKGIKPVGRTYWYDHQPVDVGEPCDEKECGCDTCHHCGEESWRFLNDLASTVRSKCGEVQFLPTSEPNLNTGVRLGELTNNLSFPLERTSRAAATTIGVGSAGMCCVVRGGGRGRPSHNKGSGVSLSCAQIFIFFT
jgi:hypothetical protein